MHKQRLFVRGLFCILFLFSGAHAETKIGFVDSQRILASFSEAVDALKKVERENDKWARALEKLTKEQESKKKEIEEKSLLLSETRKQEELKELETLAEKIRKYQVEKWGDKGEYFRKREQLLKPIFDKINTAIVEVAEDEKFNFIFDTVSGNLLYGEKKYDVTDKVLSILEDQIDTK